MFDASKLKSLISMVAGLTGNSLASTAGKLLDSYEGLCVGFAFKGNGSQTPGTGFGIGAPSSAPDSTGSQSGSQVKDILKGIFGK